jgi:hypothetical protein
MFLNGKFHELKGSQFTPELKKEFVNYFCQNKYFEVFYIVVANKRIKSKFYNNTARAFNYLIRLALSFLIKKRLLRNTGFVLQLDERNEKTDTKRFLENYLNTELFLQGITKGESTVKYFDSSTNHLIQIADVFANIYFSELMTSNYSNEIKKMAEDGYLPYIFNFPLPSK